MNLNQHATVAEELGKASRLARCISENLDKINEGYGGLRATQVDQWFAELGHILGYCVTKESK